jgi:hypothetical protein
VTPRPNFLVFLGDRYGWRPLPYEISSEEFKRLEAAIHNTVEHQLINRWYQPDKNAVPPVYCLQSRTGEYIDDPAWRAIERQLLKVLLRAATDAALAQGERLKYGCSATEQEIVHGALSVPDAADHVFGFMRRI